MSIAQDVALFNQLLDSAIAETMQAPVAETVKDYISEAVETEVYDKYESHADDPYKRKGRHGGLADKDWMVVTYDPETMTLEVWDDRRDMGEGHERDFESEDEMEKNPYMYATGRPVAPVVESGKGYTWIMSEIFWMEHEAIPLARPFHKVAEERLACSRDVEHILKYNLEKVGFKVKLGGR